MEINDIQILQNTEIFQLKIIFLLMHSSWRAPKMPWKKLDAGKKSKSLRIREQGRNKVELFVTNWRDSVMEMAPVGTWIHATVFPLTILIGHGQDSCP